MATGDVKVRSNVKRDIVLATALAANNLPPASATAGVPCYPTKKELVHGSIDVGAFTTQPLSKTRLCLKGTATAGALAGTFTLWGYLESADDWFPVRVNGGAALAETSTDKIVYTEVFDYLSHFDRLYLEVAAIAGTDPSFDAYLVSAQESF